MVLEPTKRRFTVDDYYRMAEVGLIGPDDRVELIEGEIVEMVPIGPEHATSVRQFEALFHSRVGDRAVVSTQAPVRLGDLHEPEPDVTLLVPPGNRYATRHPGPEDILLIVEVAKTTLTFDREVKLPLYARSGVPEVWLVDLEGRAVEVHRDPSTDGYHDVTVVREGPLEPEALEGVVLEVEEILP